MYSNSRFSLLLVVYDHKHSTQTNYHSFLICSCWLLTSGMREMWFCSVYVTLSEMVSLAWRAKVNQAKWHPKSQSQETSLMEIRSQHRQQHGSHHWKINLQPSMPSLNIGLVRVTPETLRRCTQLMNLWRKKEAHLLGKSVTYLNTSWMDHQRKTLMHNLHPQCMRTLYGRWMTTVAREERHTLQRHSLPDWSTVRVQLWAQMRRWNRNRIPRCRLQVLGAVRCLGRREAQRHSVAQVTSQRIWCRCR